MPCQRNPRPEPFLGRGLEGNVKEQPKAKPGLDEACLSFFVLQTLFSLFVALKDTPKDEGGDRKRQREGKIDMQGPGLVLFLAVAPMNNVGAHECLSSISAHGSLSRFWRSCGTLSRMSQIDVA